MQMIGLPEDGLVSSHSLQARLTNESGRQQDFQGSIDGGNADPMTFRQEHITDLFYGWMSLPLDQRTPDEFSLRCLLKFLLLQELLQLLAGFHPDPIIGYIDRTILLCYEVLSYEKAPIVSCNGDYLVWLR
jgi:hypothetical protein